MTFLSVVNVDPEDRRVILKDLSSASLYEAFVMVSTLGGSLNGSTIHFEIEPFGWYPYFTVYVNMTRTTSDILFVFLCFQMLLALH